MIELSDFGIGPIVWLASIAALLQIGLLVLAIVVLLDIRRFIAEAVPLMRGTSRWLAARDE